MVRPCRSTARRRAGAVLLVVVVVVASGAAALGATPVSNAAPAPCGAGVRKVSGSTRDVPVLFVHGFAGGPSNFRATRDGRPSMLDMIRGVRGVAAYTFSYAAQSLAWVTDPAIGPALAAAISCLADEHGEPVVVVAHSMGGLATQFAQGQTVEGRPVSSVIGRVITVGTPFEGAQLLTFASGAGGVVFDAVFDAATDRCDPSDLQRRARDFCGLLGTTETPAVRAMIPGSAELDGLPPWQPGLPRIPIAGDIDVTVGAFGLEQVLGLGDLAVSVDSAVAGASRGIVPFVAGCHSGFFDVLDAIDDSPCSHTNELANRRVEQRVRSLVRDAVRESAAR
jgi:pimeloyl-ACP methyl ester carboxylesterase